ncbi:lysophospholipid acyltransferase family protein [Acinetobacter pollinis]|uniref:lysophospholipid acyltransferase family protein n=1 Tax=Acinetobacter pollinis TaxID=2605270 RepID=UPI0018A2660F|nr:lysophospholipid acyltransferase family protein [Acinetobacter pollinis]MBF7690182.1 lysophospholipid acyltransferase family protein [Acinetobacter pollinis]MBF7693118.1 lysophospholipid acyltransferase family protein [Acinetobacter pollinis]MBF7697577.1 lysophospholipid acyltransferase family protein [Acinetobacter pollinis]MBF7699718.1 lysophospholipid acyltransferase family protein [Acinetobacter pollinis]
MQPLKIFRYIPLKALQNIAQACAWWLNRSPEKGMLRKVLINLKLVYPHLQEKEREKIAKQSVIKQCMSYAEFMKCWAMPPQWSINQVTTVHQLDVLTQALADPRGALIITPHLGTWEIMNAWVHQYGKPTIMYKPIKEKIMNDFVLHSREGLQSKLVPTDATGVKLLFKNLKEGGFSVILPDHVPHPSGGVIVPFFSIHTLTSTLASKMAQKTGCRLVGLSCFRKPDGQGFEVYCDALDNPNLYNKDIHIATTAMNEAIEEMIKRSPSDYMWGYKRFRHVPDIPDVYK